MEERTVRLVDECKRQSESCRYAAATLYEWIKTLRQWRVGFIVVPLVLAGFAAFLKKDAGSGWTMAASICTLLAGLAPAISKALDFDVNLEGVAKHAHQFRVLRDRFRQAALVTALGPFDDFKKEFDDLMSRRDGASGTAPTAPEKFFKRAQTKISAGDYSFEVDAAGSGKSGGGAGTGGPEVQGMPSAP